MIMQDHKPVTPTQRKESRADAIMGAVAFIAALLFVIIVVPYIGGGYA